MTRCENNSYVTEEYVSRLNDLNEAIKAGSIDDANKLIGELTTLRESTLFQEVGKLTREIHNSISAFSSDQRVVKLSEESILDAKERLNFIITKTNSAAHRTMNSAEQAVDIIHGLDNEAKEVHKKWTQFKSGEMTKDDFVTLSHDIDLFLSSVNTESDQVKAKMSDIMMAQDYQDLTGQMIRQVISIVQEAEEKLVRLVAVSSSRNSPLQTGAKATNGARMDGPQLPSADKKSVVGSQDEVDDLLASLGF